MKDNRRPDSAVIIAAAAIIGLYFGGYGVLRARCTGVAPYFVVPSTNSQQADALITLYKPLFYAERKLTGHHFSVTPWGMDVGF
jgi:hypothetical protein